MEILDPELRPIGKAHIYLTPNEALELRGKLESFLEHHEDPGAHFHVSDPDLQWDMEVYMEEMSRPE